MPVRFSAVTHNQAPGGQPLQIALVDDYEVVVRGVASLFDGYGDRVVVTELDAGQAVTTNVDIALLDTFAQAEADRSALQELVDNPHARRVVVYTWCTDPIAVDITMAAGVDGYLSKTLTASGLVDALERVAQGERVVITETEQKLPSVGLDWPGRNEGLTERESEVVALITAGHRNTEIAAMTFLSVNTIKSYIRSAYRKIGVTSRSQAVLWGVRHGFGTDVSRIDPWR
ncbi:response regulator transcription factor [soil metagenome]